MTKTISPKPFLVAALMIMLTGCTTTTSSAGSTNTTRAISVNSYSASQVALHNSAADCWMIINNKVYNITDYVGSHPGGSIILEGCGKDATQLFETKGGQGTGHSSLATNILDQFFVGDLKQP